jgi:HK97 family phage portal protein
MGFLDSLFGLEKKELGRSGGRGGWFSVGTSGSSSLFGLNSYDGEKAFTQGYEKVLHVFRCVDVIAGNASTLPVRVRKGNPTDGEFIDDKHLDIINLLNRRPNFYETAQQFRYRLSTQLLLSRKGAFIHVIKTNGGRIASVHLLIPHMVEPLKHATEYVTGYRVHSADGSHYDLEKHQVLWMRVKPHPTDSYAQMTPLVAAGLAADTDYYARLYNRNFLANDGRPGGILNVKGNVSPRDADTLSRRFSGGLMHAGKITVTQGDDVQYTDLAASPRDVMWDQAIAGSKLDLQLAFGVPESVMGNASGRCVDEDTEALTQRGWVNGRDLTTDDTILSCDPADGRLKWSPIHEVYRNENYAGSMYRLKHSHADFLVTPGHNWLTTDGKLVKVEDLNTRSRLVAMGEAEDDNDKELYDSDFVELVGWAVTEGYYGGKDSAYVRIRQNDGPNAIAIEDALNRSGALYSSHFDGKRWLFNVRGDVAEQIERIAPDKVMTQEFINDLTSGQRQLLMDVMVDGDGCRQSSTRSVTFAQKNKQASEAFVYLATLCGYTTSMRERFYTQTYKGVTKDMSDWIVIVRDRKVMTTQRNTISVERYEGMVWCPRTDYGTFVARRNGRVIVTGNTYDNADAEREGFWKDTMVPHCDAIAIAGYDTLTPGGWDDDSFVVHDYSDIDVLKRVEKAKHDKLKDEFTSGMITLKEYWKGTGRDTTEVEDNVAFNGLWMPGGLVPVALDPDQQEAMSALVAPTDGAAAPGTAPVAAERSARDGAAEGVVVAFDRARRLAANDESARSLRLSGKASGLAALETKALALGTRQMKTNGTKQQEYEENPDEPHRVRLESQVLGILDAWSRRQEQTVFARLNGTKVLKHTRYWEPPGDRAFDASYVVDVERWVLDLRSDIEAALTEFSMELVEGLTDRMDEEGILEALLAEGVVAPASDRVRLLTGMKPELALSFPLRPVIDMVEQSARRQSVLLMEAIRETEQERKDIKAAGDRMRKTVRGRESWKRGLALHTATATVEGIKQQSLIRATRHLDRVWMTQRDEVVRGTHASAHGQRAQGVQPFTVGGFPMMFPGDPLAPIQETANCRCWVVYRRRLPRGR